MDIMRMREEISSFVNNRKEDGHKGSFGKLLIIAGSQGMVGAAVLSARGAQSMGIGLVTLALPRELQTIGQISVVEAVCIDRDRLVAKDVFKNYDAVVFGPGLGDNPEDGRLLHRILSLDGGKMVLDADGLNLISRCGLEMELKKSRLDVLMTPHQGEARRLLAAISIDENGRHGDLASLVDGFEKTVILKGHESLIGGVGMNPHNNLTGNHGMATAGSGDVLAGICGAMMAQGYSGYDAGMLSTYVHGMAGDMAADEIGSVSMTATDIVYFLRKTVKNFQKR